MQRLQTLDMILVKITIFLCTVVGLKMQQYNQMAVLWWSRKSSDFNSQSRLLILAWSIAGYRTFPSYLNSLSLSVLSCNNSQGCEDCGNIWQVWGHVCVWFAQQFSGGKCSFGNWWSCQSHDHLLCHMIDSSKACEPIRQ